ncbi:MAG TPA: TetR family transcriptional regulator, partial [Pseudorhodoferax sp.]|nr:TetR family transcriptional regulator [Pseudorhodoferax sp.]
MTARQDAPAATWKFAQKRQALLAAAADLFNQRGVKGATLSDVAASVGLVKNSVAYYYRRKEELAAACFLDAIADHHRFIDRAQEQASVAARVQALFGQLAQRLAAIADGTQPALMLFHDLRALPPPHLET